MHLIHEEGGKSIDPKIIIEKRGKIIKCNVEGNCKISSDATVANSTIAKYFAIGNYSFMQRTVCSRYVTIGSRVSIGAFSHPTNWLSTLEFQFRDSEPFYGENIESKNRKSIGSYIKTVSIGSDCWIGDNSFIKTGLEIGSGSIIGAGSVVVKNVEPYSIVAGNPAKVIKYRFKEETIKKLMKLKWWELEISQLNGVEFTQIDKAIEQIMKIKESML